MAYPKHSTPAPAPDNQAAHDALCDVFSTLLELAGPKREAKARRELEAFATRLETFNGRHIPGPNVVPIRSTWSEMERADEERRRSRAEHAAHVRSLLDRFFADPPR